MKNAVFWWEKVQKWLWNRGDIMIILRSIQSSTNRHKSGLGTRFHRLYYPIIILDKDCLWTEYWGCWRDLIAMHHFGRTDGLFAGNKSFEIVQLLCVVSVSVIVTNNRLMWQRSLFFKIALAVIIWTEKEVLFPFLFKLLLCFYKQYIVCYM